MYHNATILIVEDERIAAEFLKEILEAEGFLILSICDKASDAIKKAMTLKPDIIFMDIMLKDHMSGCEAALKISSLIDTKIIFLTAHAEDEMIEYALDAGAVNYLIKPYREKQIIATVQMALNQKHKISNKLHKLRLTHSYEYDLNQKALYLKGQHIEIGFKSTKLIDYLCQHINTPVSYLELSNYIYNEEKQSSALRTLISRLNTTLNHTLIININGIGYMISSC